MRLPWFRHASREQGRHSTSSPGTPTVVAPAMTAAPLVHRPAPVPPTVLEAPHVAPGPVIAPADVTPVPDPASLPGLPADGPQVASAGAQDAATGGGVALGFADGQSVVLDDDDPRVRTFREAAAALLDAPRS